MSAPHDPLWEPRPDAPGPRDAELDALERVLRPLRHDGRPFDVAALPAAAPRRAARPFVATAAALVAALAAVLAIWAWLGRGDGVHLAPGDLPRRIVADGAPVPMFLGTLASIDLLPGGELEAVAWAGGEARLRLVRGGMRVAVATAPGTKGHLVVETPYGGVREHAARFHLALDRDSLEVRVDAGMVEVAGTRTVVVPAGAATRAFEKRVATPLFDDAPAGLRGLVQKLDEATAQQLGGQRKELVDRTVMACNAPRDTLVLWHLLHDANESFRDLAELRLLDLVGPPPDVELAPSKAPAAPRLDPAVWLAFLQGGAWRQPR